MKRKDRQLLFAAAVLVLLELAGLTLAVQAHRWKFFLYYTYDSNLLGLISGVLLIFEILLRRKHPERLMPQALHRLRFVSACTMEVTLVTVAFLFLPAAALSNGMSAAVQGLFLEGDAIYVHLLAPLWNLLMFLLLEWDPPLKFTDTGRCLLWSVIYTAVLVLLNAGSLVDGPYPFFQVHSQPVLLSVLLAMAAFAGNYFLICCTWLVSRAVGTAHWRKAQKML